jgi:hypothetical protein
MILVGAANPRCDPGWTLFADRCFIYEKSELAWKDAESVCFNDFKGAHLVSIHSEAENQFINGTEDFIFNADDHIISDQIRSYQRPCCLEWGMRNRGENFFKVDSIL